MLERPKPVDVDDSLAVVVEFGDGTAERIVGKQLNLPSLLVPPPRKAVAPGRRRRRGPDGAAPLRPRRGRRRGEGHLLRRGGLRVDAGLRRRGLPGAAAGQRRDRDFVSFASRAAAGRALH